jgi:hypothetical protein
MAWYSGKKLLNMQYLFGFSLSILSETFLILWRIQRDTIIMCKGLHIKNLLLSDFNQMWIFLTDFRKILKYQISDMMKLLFALCNFMNMPKKKPNSEQAVSRAYKTGQLPTGLWHSVTELTNRKWKRTLITNVGNTTTLSYSKVPTSTYYTQLLSKLLINAKTQTLFYPRENPHFRGYIHSKKIYASI